MDEMSRAVLERAGARIGEPILERYRIDSVLGAGGLGVVYRALDCVSGDSVAIKILRDDMVRMPGASARFLREVRIARALEHPAIPRGLATGIDRTGAPLLVM